MGGAELRAEAHEIVGLHEARTQSAVPAHVLLNVSPRSRRQFPPTVAADSWAGTSSGKIPETIGRVVRRRIGAEGGG
jgi:hypothetical protein